MEEREGLLINSEIQELAEGLVDLLIDHWSDRWISNKESDEQERTAEEGLIFKNNLWDSEKWT